MSDRTLVPRLTLVALALVAVLLALVGLTAVPAKLTPQATAMTARSVIAAKAAPLLIARLAAARDRRTDTTDTDAPFAPQPRSHTDRFIEMARCHPGPGCVMPEGFVGKYGPYRAIPGEQALETALLLALPVPWTKAAGVARVGGLLKWGACSRSSTAVTAANAGDDLLRLSTKDSWGKLDTLDDHFLRHGADFGARSADDYARQASEFFQRGLKNGLPTKVDPKTGVLRVYDPATNTFGAYNPSGTTRTFYKPDPAAHGYASNWDYWLAQPGYTP